MYGKLFESAFTGSLFGSGPTVFAVWAYVIANANDSHVELNPKLLAPCIGTNIDDVRHAIDYLCQPDPESRNTDADGRRLIRLEAGGHQYQVPSWQKYRDIRTTDDRREYMRAYMRDWRENRKQKCLPKLTQANSKLELARLAHTEAETEADKKNLAVNGRDRFAEWFETFWRAYPRKAKKPAALKAFRAVKPDEAALAQMLAAIEVSKTTEQWQDPKYIPHPATWLNNRRWEDEAELPLTENHRNAVPGTRFVA